MRNPLDVLQQKEIELARVRREIEALHCVAPLLAEVGEARNDPPRMRDAANPVNRWPLDVDEHPHASAGA